MNCEQRTSISADVRVKFVGDDLYLRVADDCKLEMTAISEPDDMQMLIISGGDLIFHDVGKV